MAQARPDHAHLLAIPLLFLLLLLVAFDERLQLVLLLLLVQATRRLCLLVIDLLLVQDLRCDAYVTQV